MNRSLIPPHLGPPSAHYSLAVVSDAGRSLYSSGIGPVEPDGSVPESIEHQAKTVWVTIQALLTEGEMTVDDVVLVTTYVVVPPTDPESFSGRLDAIMAARDSALNGHRCASVLVPVPALATPSWMVEVAVVARAD